MAHYSAQDKAKLKEYPQVFTRHISVGHPLMIASGIVDSFTVDNDTFGTTGIQVSGFSEHYANRNIYPGATVVAGVDQETGKNAKFRLKSISGNTINVQESSTNRYVLAPGVPLYILEEYLPWSKPVRIQSLKTGDATYSNDFIEYHDYDIPYTGQNKNISPKSNITLNTDNPFPPRYAAQLYDGNTAEAFEFSGRHSFGNGGVPIVSYLWDVSDGDILQGEESSETIVVEFEQGFRYIHLTVTDGNGTSARQSIPVWVHGNTYPSQDHGVVTKDSTSDIREMAFKFSGYQYNNYIENFPDATVICYWEDGVRFGGEEDPPAEYRHSFLGYITDEAYSPGMQYHSVEVNATTAAGWMKLLSCFSQIVTDVTTDPTTWSEMSGTTIEKIIFYILQEYTTFNQIANLFLPEYNYESPGETFSSGSIWDEINGIAEGYNAIALSDSSGAIFVRREPSLRIIDDGEEVFELAISEDDIPAGDTTKIGFRHSDELIYVTSSGGTYSYGNDPQFYYSIAPSLAINRMGDSGEMPFQRLPSTNTQEVLNRLTGQYYSRGNQAIAAVSVDLIGNWDVFEPAWGVTITLLFTELTLRHSMSNRGFQVKSVNTAHSDTPPYKKISLTLEPLPKRVNGMLHEPPSSNLEEMLLDEDLGISIPVIPVIEDLKVDFTNPDIGSLPNPYYPPESPSLFDDEFPVAEQDPNPPANWETFSPNTGLEELPVDPDVFTDSDGVNIIRSTGTWMDSYGLRGITKALPISSTSDWTIECQVSVHSYFPHLLINEGTPVPEPFDTLWAERDKLTPYFGMGHTTETAGIYLLQDGTGDLPIIGIGIGAGPASNDQTVINDGGGSVSIMRGRIGVFVLKSTFTDIVRANYETARGDGLGAYMQDFPDDEGDITYKGSWKSFGTSDFQSTYGLMNYSFSVYGQTFPYGTAFLKFTYNSENKLLFSFYSMDGFHWTHVGWPLLMNSAVPESDMAGEHGYMGLRTLTEFNPVGVVLGSERGSIWNPSVAKFRHFRYSSQFEGPFGKSIGGRIIGVGENVGVGGTYNPNVDNVGYVEDPNDPNKSGGSGDNPTEDPNLPEGI